MRRLYWDFYGARATGTADHFRIHLNDFIAKLEFSDCETGLDIYTPAHSAAWCNAPETACDVLVTRLRPHRAERLDKI
jgi:hypothetical protein